MAKENLTVTILDLVQQAANYKQPLHLPMTQDPRKHPYYSTFLVTARHGLHGKAGGSIRVQLNHKKMHKDINTCFEASSFFRRHRNKHISDFEVGCG